MMTWSQELVEKVSENREMPQEPGEVAAPASASVSEPPPAPEE